MDMYTYFCHWITQKIAQIAKQSVLPTEPTHPLLWEEMYIFLIPFSNTLTSVPGLSSVGLG